MKKYLLIVISAIFTSNLTFANGTQNQPAPASNLEITEAINAKVNILITAFSHELQSLLKKVSDASYLNKKSVLESQIEEVKAKIKSKMIELGLSAEQVLAIIAAKIETTIQQKMSQAMSAVDKSIEKNFTPDEINGFGILVF